MEPDCAFYVGERARGYRAAAMEGEAAADAFLERTAPDLVVEVEITSVDAGKIERYRDLGVRELWWLHGRKGTRDLQVDFLALLPGEPPRPLPASALLGGLTENDIREAVDGVWFGVTLQERTAAVTRIVRRRQRASVRVREADAPYASDATP